MIRNILFSALRYWFNHPWQVFWGAIVGFYVLGLMLTSVLGMPSYEVERICRGIFFLVLGFSSIQGLRMTWKTSPLKLAIILAIWGSLPLLNHVPGFSVQGIVFASVWTLIPVCLAVVLDIVVKRIAYDKK